VKKTAIVAALRDFGPSYSVASCVMEHLEVVSRNRPTVLVVTDDFVDYQAIQHLVDNNGLEVRTFPRWHFRHDDLKSTETFVKESVDRTVECFKEVSAAIVHDLAFIEGFFPANLLLREAAKSLPKVKWLLVAHSAPTVRDPEHKAPNSRDFPNALFVTLNRLLTKDMAAQYKVPEGKVRAWHNPVDPGRFHGWHPLTSEIYHKHRLWEYDYVCLYPTRMVPSKQPDKAIKLMAHLGDEGRCKTFTIIANSFSNGEKEKDYIDSVVKTAGSLGYQDDLLITSRMDSDWARQNKYNLELGLPHAVVKDLFRYSDVFVLPSMSEACSLIMLEASLTKNCMVLNEDLFSLYDFTGQKAGTHDTRSSAAFQFGSLKRPITQYNPSEEAWFRDHARILLEHLNQDRALVNYRRVRKEHDPNFIYWNSIEPEVS
jgi:glycosyltransferase involved in cell wall biosynthesis